LILTLYNSLFTKNYNFMPYAFRKPSLHLLRLFSDNYYPTCLKKFACFFWAYFIRIAKRNNFVEEFFSIRALFRRENSIWKFKTTGTTRTFWEETTKTSNVVVKNWGFQIEFYRRKRARIEKKSSTKLFLFAIRIK
jgi:hypothetical protein